MINYFEHYISSDSFHLKYAKGEPSVKGQEFHDYHEFVLFLDGRSRLISKNIQKELKIGSLVIVPKACFHQFWVSENNYTRLILGFRETEEIAMLIKKVMSEVKVIENPDIALSSVLSALIEITESDISQDEKELFIRASIIHILIHLKKHSKGFAEIQSKLSPTVQKALSYIDVHYTEDISADSIAEALHVSVSLLFHKFKDELKISVYQYVSKKRLANARLLIEAGETASTAAISSGFSNYSVFFRMYKKYYGEPPSRLRKRSDFMQSSE